MIDMNFHVQFYSEDGSIAELSSMSPNEVVGFNVEFTLNLTEAHLDNTLYFNRIKVKKEGIGVGTALMNEVIQFLDKHAFCVVLEARPYGQMKLNALISFYKKFGFVLNAKSEDSAVMSRQGVA